MIEDLARVLAAIALFVVGVGGVGALVAWLGRRRNGNANITNK
jgi:hypothetical protein